MMQKVTMAVLALFWLNGCVPKKEEIPREEIDDRPAVEVLNVDVGHLVERGNYFGKLEANSATLITAEVGGEVISVEFDEGDSVPAGELLLSMDDEPFRIAEEQAGKAQEAAGIRVTLLERSIALERKNIDAGIQQAEAALDGAKARQRLVEKGARSEEKKQARAAREAARVALESGRTEYERIRSLYEGGAATKQMLDNAGSQLEGAQARYDQAEQVYRITVKGAREEDKDAVRATVKQAEAALIRARAAEDSLAIREQELAAAKVQVAQAGLQLEQAQLQRRKAKVSSPLQTTTKVAVRSIDPGEMAAPGRPLFELLEMHKLILTLQVPAREVGFLKEGTVVTISCIGDAVEGGNRTATVTTVGIKANPQNTTFPVELEVDNQDGGLRVGQICEAYPQLNTHDLPLVPRASVLDTEEGKVIMLVVDGRAKEEPVKLAAVRKGIAAVETGVEVGSQAIIVGERLVKDGDEVNVVGTHPPLEFPAEEEE